MEATARQLPAHTHAGPAYHEAGHFVIGDELGIPVTSVKLSDGEDGTLGSVTDTLTNSDEYHRLKSSDDPEDLPRQIGFLMFLFAGQTAEEMFTGLSDGGGSWRDNAEAEEISFSVSLMKSTEHNALKTWARLRVANLLLRPLVWAKVSALAEALLARGELSAHEARQVCAEWDGFAALERIPAAWEGKRAEAEERLRAANRAG